MKCKKCGFPLLPDTTEGEKKCVRCGYIYHNVPAEYQNVEASRRNIFEEWSKWHWTITHPGAWGDKDFEVGKFVKICRRGGKSEIPIFTCWCIGHVLSRMKECFIWNIMGTNKQMIFEKPAIRVAVITKTEEIKTCDIPFAEDKKLFHTDYQKLVSCVREQNKTHVADDDYMVVNVFSFSMRRAAKQSGSDILGHWFGQPQSMIDVLYNYHTIGFWRRTRMLNVVFMCPPYNTSMVPKHRDDDDIKYYEEDTGEKFVSALQAEMDNFEI